MGLDSGGGGASGHSGRGGVPAVAPLRLASHEAGREAGSPPPCRCHPGGRVVRGDTHLSHFCRYAKYRALRLPGSACPRPRDELERAHAVTQSSVRRLERMAQCSGRWEVMPACLRLPKEACITFQLTELLRSILDVITQVLHPW